MEGNEGAVGMLGLLGGTNFCNLSIVREPGHAMRLGITSAQNWGAGDNPLRPLLQRYLHALMTQIAQVGVCNRFHNVESRFACWLMMTRDRLDSNVLRGTHDSIAHRLGVRRSSITAAAHHMLTHQIISYTRGRIDILDMARLEAASCSCYGVIKQQYDSFLD